MPVLEPVNCRILITGATGAIGGALAEMYAAPGVELHLHGRNEGKLAAVEARCVALGATVLTERFDLRDTTALRGWLDALCAKQALDLVIVNAGMNTDIGPAGEGSRGTKSRRCLTSTSRPAWRWCMRCCQPCAGGAAARLRWSVRWPDILACL